MAKCSMLQFAAMAKAFRFVDMGRRIMKGAALTADYLFWFGYVRQASPLCSGGLMLQEDNYLVASADMLFLL
jgi:hypothetical protein